MCRPLRERPLGILPHDPPHARSPQSIYALIFEAGY